MEQDFTVVIGAPDGLWSTFIAFVKAETAEQAINKACDFGEAETGIQYVGVAIFNGVHRDCLLDTFDWR